ncbi:MAG: hypothetical protein ACE5FF_09850 [Saprospiraceae bacterium]
MPTWLNVVLEIIKITVPALIVFLTVYYLLKTYLDKQYQMKMLEFKQKQKDTTIPLRLQAYERLSLFCERISIPNLVLRLNKEKQNAAAFRLALLLTIQQEFEYNITQQVYVSEQLWQIIKISRDNTVGLIEGIAEQVDPKAPAEELVNHLLKYVETAPSSATDKALAAIKKEATILM